MDAILENIELLRLYVTGKSKKIRLPEHITDKFFATLQKIEEAANIHDLLADNGLRFEKLVGYKKRYSMRLSGKYRLEKEVEWMDEKQLVGKFYLLTISNHYGE